MKTLSVSALADGLVNSGSDLLCGFATAELLFCRFEPNAGRGDG